MSNREHLVSPSLLSCDFSRIGEEVRKVEAAGADWIHVDVMDGRFVPNITIGPLVTKAIKKHATKPLDVHLMIVEPEKHVAQFAEAGADWIAVHAEACDHLHNTIRMMKHDEPFMSRGVKAGAALNPHTPIGILDYVLEDLDLIVIMTVNPGWGAQPHIPRTLRKIDELRERFEQLGMTDPPLIEVDGGVKAHNAGDFAGADVFVSGSGVFGWEGGDYAEAIRQIKANAAKA